MRRFAPAVLLPGLLALSPPASAGTAWLCTLSDDAVRLVCVADADPRDADPEPAAPPAAVVRGQRFPLDPRQVYTVDLWSPASEPDRLELLARATICYRSPGCTVTMAPVRWSVAQMPRAPRAQPR